MVKNKKEVSNKLNKKLKSLSKEKVSNKNIFKKSDMIVHIKDYKAPSILGDENRFFKGTFEKEKRSMFF